MNRSVGIWVMVAALAVPASGVWAGDGPLASDAEKAKMHVDAAKKFLAANNIMGARQQLDLALKLDKKNFDALYLMGLTHYREGNMGGTMKFMLDALKVNPKHQQASFYVGKAELDLEHLDKAEKYLKAARDAKEGFFEDPVQRDLVPYYYGVCLVKASKGKEGVKILNEMAEGGKFEQFGARQDILKKLYYEGYMFTGEAYTVLGLYKDADRWLSKAIANGKQINEGKIPGADLHSVWLHNKLRVPVDSQGQVQGDTFLNPTKKLLLKKPKGWDFLFIHPEGFSQYTEPDKAYDQATRSAGAEISLIHKNKERMYEKLVTIVVDAWDLRTNLSMGGEDVQLSSPKDVARTKLVQIQEKYEPFLNRKIRPPMPMMDKGKFNNEYSGAWFKGSFRHKENKDVKMDVEFICFKGKEFSYFVNISGDHGIFEKYGREIEMIKKSIKLQE